MAKRRNFFTGLILLGVLVVAGFSLISCEGVTGFFSNSWGENLKRDPKILVGDVKPSNVKEMVKTFVGDPEASKALLEEISKKAKDYTGTDKVVLQSAGLTAAVNASELGTTILESAGKFLNNSDTDEEEAMKKVADALNGLPNVTEIADDLETLFGAPSGGYIYSDFSANSKAGNDLVMGAVICLLADYQETDKDNLEDYIDEFAETLDNKDEDGIVANLSEHQKTAYYLLKTASDITVDGVLGDLLKEFHFDE
jgi:hypothetical protein